MFGKSEQKKIILPDVKVTKIPDDFYAGTNPIVKFQNIEKIIKPVKVEKVVLSSADKKLLDKKTAVGTGNKLHPINLFASWKFLILASLVILIIGGSIVGFYYWWNYRKTLPSNLEPIQPIVTEPIITQPNAEELAPTSTAAAEPVLPTIALEAKLEFPSSLLGDSDDTDQDGLTNVAEELFGTDSAVPDSDADKFSDGHEVFYLYNPAGKEPLKLIDSGLVNIYANPSFLYKIYYPKSWAVGNVDTAYTNVLFSTITGENIEVKVFDIDPTETFNNWFARNASGEQLVDYIPFESVFKEKGYYRKDELVYFIPKENKIFVILYHTTDSSVVNYRSVIKMLARSFQFGDMTDVQVRPIEENLNNVNTSSTVVSSSEVSL